MKKILIAITLAFVLFSLVACDLIATDVKAPYIQDGYWYVNGENTGVRAEGVDGSDGKDGKDAVASGEDSQGLAFYPQDDGTYVVGGGNAKYMKNITIPETYRGGAVVAVEENAFKDFTALEKISIPNSVTQIGRGVFSGCTALKEISMPCYEYTHGFVWLCLDPSINSISSDDYIPLPPVETIHITGGTAIPNSMFYVFGAARDDFTARLKTLTISDSITSIGQYAFASCPDSLFEEENGIRYIGKWAIGCTDADFSLRADTVGIASWALVPENYEFDETVTRFTIPASIKYLSPAALLVAPNITEYLVDGGNDSYCAVDGVVYTKDMTALVQYPIAKTQDTLVLPESVENIYPSAFYRCQVKSITLPDGMTEISDEAFAGCALEHIDIPSSVKWIGSFAFSGTELETIVLPEGITEIPFCAFEGSRLSSITIPSTVTKIEAYAFSNTNISTIEIPSGVTEIGEGAFSRTKLQRVTLPSGITEIADGTFNDCYMLTSIAIPDSVTRIGDNAFHQCSALMLVQLPKNLKSIGENAFYFSAVRSINIPAGLTQIGENAFSGCNIIEIINDGNYKLNDLRTGSSANGYLAYNAKEIHYGESKIVTVGEYLFYTYNNTNYLIGYTGNDTDLCLPESYNGQGYEIYRGAFRDRSEYHGSPLYSVIIPDCVTNIGGLAFYSCGDLKEIVIGSSVTAFGSQAFDGCGALEKVYYKGSEAEWSRITHQGWLSEYLREAPRYYYSDTAPTDGGSYWHYVDGVPTAWE